MTCDVSWLWARRERGDAASYWLLSPLARHAHSHTRTLTCFPFFPTDFRGKDGLLAVYSFRSWNFLGAQAGSRLGDTREQRGRENLSATKLWSKKCLKWKQSPVFINNIQTVTKIYLLTMRYLKNERNSQTDSLNVIVKLNARWISFRSFVHVMVVTVEKIGPIRKV